MTGATALINDEAGPQRTASHERNDTMYRTNTVELVVDKETHKKLVELGELSAKCWNEVNWLRMQQFKRGERVDFKTTHRVAYHKYSDKLGADSTTQVIRANTGAWKTFFTLIKKKKRGKLPNWFKPRPPGYWKNKDGSYKLIILFTHHQYELNEEDRSIYLKRFKMTLKYLGTLKWHGKPRGLVIVYNPARKKWYAYIRVEVERPKPVEVGQRASVDLGIVNLATVYIEDGTWLLFKGGSVLSRFEHYVKKISRTAKLLARHKQKASRRLKLLYDKRKRFMRHVINSMVRKIMTELKQRGVAELIVGYPTYIATDTRNWRSIHFWRYGYTINRFKMLGEELGIRVVTVNESYTSVTCSLCGEVHPNGRIFRGLYKCPRTGQVINADLNGAINILHIPESRGATGKTTPVARDRGNGPKARPVVYRWTNGAGWVATPTSNEVVRMKAVNHK